LDAQELYRRHCCQMDQTLLYERPLVVERAQGCRVWFAGEHEPYLDLVCGYSSTNLGHCHPRLQRRLAELAARFDHVHSLTTAPAVELAGKLCGLLGRPEQYRVYYTVGGAAAADAAVRLARAFSRRPVVASFTGAFHGYSLGALPLTDRAFVAPDQFAPLAGERLAVPFGDLPGCRRILEANRARVGGLIVEAVQGAAGFEIPPEGFLAEVRELCRRLELVFIADEIQVGLGRTGRMLALEHSGVRDPDVVLLGKSLGGGYYPLSAVVARKEVFESIPAAGSTFGDTFSHNAVGCGLGLEVLDILQNTPAIADGRARGAEMLGCLQELKGRYARVSRVWGLGPALALELAGPGAPALAADLVRAGLAERVLLYATGVRGDRLKFAPALTMTAEELQEACARVARAFARVLG
jgi:acetylornithine/succinyldiaminopimelate/putrescine aminotransferase